jgi:hypothetical protein
MRDIVKKMGMRMRWGVFFLVDCIAKMGQFIEYIECIQFYLIVLVLQLSDASAYI